MKFKRMLSLILLVTILISYWVNGGLVYGQESRNEVLVIPDTEVKFLIDPDLVLDENGNLLAEVADLFGGFDRDRNRRITMQFMDTPCQVFNENGWMNRIRYRDWTQPNEGYQITYRRRIPIWPVNEQIIGEAVEQAYADGFYDWDINIDWSYDSAVLTLSYTVQTGGPVSNEFLNDEIARVLLQDHLPEQVARHYSQELLASFDRVVVHGPVIFRRYEFNFPGTNERILRIEVLPFTQPDGSVIDYLVEVSFEFENEGNLEVIRQRREEIQVLLNDAGILLPESGLRASVVLDRYSTSYRHDEGSWKLMVGFVLLTATLLLFINWYIKKIKQRG